MIEKKISNMVKFNQVSLVIFLKSVPLLLFDTDTIKPAGLGPAPKFSASKTKVFFPPYLLQRIFFQVLRPFKNASFLFLCLWDTKTKIWVF